MSISLASIVALVFLLLLDRSCALTFQVFNDLNVVQGQVQILQLLQVAKVLWKIKEEPEASLWSRPSRVDR